MSKDNSRKYTKEFKASVLKRLEPPTSKTVANLSEEFKIPRTTIYQWINSANRIKKSENIPKPTGKWTSEDKFHVVLETAILSEDEMAAYCRRKGLYVEEIKIWRKQCIEANMRLVEDPLKQKTELKEEKQKNKFLEKDLRIKEKALAEIAALLVLRKKANAIWGDPEDE